MMVKSYCWRAITGIPDGPFAVQEEALAHWREEEYVTVSVLTTKHITSEIYAIYSARLIFNISGAT